MQCDWSYLRNIASLPLQCSDGSCNLQDYHICRSEGRQIGTAGNPRRGEVTVENPFPATCSVSVGKNAPRMKRGSGSVVTMHRGTQRDCQYVRCVGYHDNGGPESV